MVKHKRLQRELKQRRMDHSTSSIKWCQWIEEEPTLTDDCKCKARVIAGKPYCQTHYDRAYIRGGNCFD